MPPPSALQQPTAPIRNGNTILRSGTKKIGDLQKLEGKVEDALRAYRDSLLIVERLIRTDAGNAVWQRAVAISHEKIGSVLEEQGNFAGALQATRDGPLRSHRSA